MNKFSFMGVGLLFTTFGITLQAFGYRTQKLKSSPYRGIQLAYLFKRKSTNSMFSVTFNWFQQQNLQIINGVCINQMYARFCVCVINVLLDLLPPDGSSWTVRLCFDVKDHLFEGSILRFEMLVSTTLPFFGFLFWKSFSFAGEIPKWG